MMSLIKAKQIDGKQVLTSNITEKKHMKCGLVGRSIGHYQILKYALHFSPDLAYQTVVWW